MSDRIVLNSRVRLARNLDQIPFPMWADRTSSSMVGEKVKAAVASRTALAAHRFYSMSEVDPIQRQMWVESHVVTPDFAFSEGEKYLVTSDDSDLSITVNEEDHLRIQVISDGLSLENSLGLATLVDDELETELDYAFSKKLGYLTACPSNVGTGMRASLMLHLPALVMTGKAQELMPILSQAGITVRGMFGEGAQAAGNIFQLSNSQTIGVTEEGILENLATVADQVIERERSARKGMVVNSKDRLADQSYRAFGILNSARIMSFEEALELTSMVRLGAETGILTDVDPNSLDRVWKAMRSAHLEKIAGRSIGPDKEEIVRAQVIRSILNTDVEEG